MNPSETSAPLYPTQIAPQQPPSLRAWRDGTFGQRYAPGPQRESAYDNGIFGHGVGDVPSAEATTTTGGGAPRAYRDGVFSRVPLAERSHSAERVTAFHDGIFGPPVGEITITHRDTEDGQVVTIDDDMLWLKTGLAALVIGATVALLMRKR